VEALWSIAAAPAIDAILIIPHICLNTTLAVDSAAVPVLRG
jgi:hypothetical protein